MNPLGTIAREGILLQRRDKIFLPAVVISITVIALANLASDWSIEDFSKILFDVGVFGFHLMGGVVALLWGVKTVTDARQEGALDVQLAAPVGRGTWLVGRYLGLAGSLGLLAVVFVVLWQAFMLGNKFGWLKPEQWLVFAMLFLEWLVVAAVAVFFAVFCRIAVALFSTAALWLAGLFVANVRDALAPTTPELTKRFVAFLAWAWDLTRFNLVDLLTSGRFPDHATIAWLAASAILWIVVILAAASLVFSRRDLIY